MMASVRSMTDDELHAALLLIGISTPVTASTRPLLVKKLLTAKANKRIPVSPSAAPQRQTRRGLHNISSDEEEGGEEAEEEEDEEEEEDDEEEEEEEEDDTEEEYEMEINASANESSNRNNTSAGAGHNRSNLFRYNNSNSIVTRRNHSINNSSNHSSNNNSSSKVSVRSSVRTSTPSSSVASPRTAVRSRQLDGLATSGKLFPSVSPRSPRWKLPSSRPVEYDTASDNDDILLNGSQATTTTYTRHNNSSGGRTREDAAAVGARSSKSRRFFDSYNNTDSDSYDQDNDKGSSARYVGRATTNFSSNNGSEYARRNAAAAAGRGGGALAWFNRLVFASKTPESRGTVSSSKPGSKFSFLRLPFFSPRTTTASPSVRASALQRNQSSSSSSSSAAPGPSIPWPGVPMLLLLLLLLFFSMLTMSYVSMMNSAPPLEHHLSSTFTSGGGVDGGADDTPGAAAAWDAIASKELEGDGLKLPLCSPSAPPSLTCLTLAEVSVAQRILSVSGRRVVAEAERRAVEYQCGVRGQRHLEVDELGNWLGDWGQLKDSSERSSAVTALAKLSALNPSLGLEPVYEQPPGEGGAEEGGLLLGLRLRQPKLHLLCAFMNLATGCLYCLALLALGGGVFYMVLTVVRSVQHKRQQHQQKVYELVAAVVSLVQSSSSSFTSIEHVRDQLLSPQQRVAWTRLWGDVVAFVDKHESRILREVRVVGGEDTEVWRWIGGTSNVQSAPSVADQSQATAGNQSQVTAGVTSPAAGGNQSQATADVTSPAGRGAAPNGSSASPSIYPKLPTLGDDDELDGSLQRWWQGAGVSRTRSAVQAPTRCLKIRNMRPDTSVQRAVVLKCRGLPILHLAVDQHSPEGVVYLMADSAQTAGSIHSLLHGCWFAGQLLSVKFLRDERYLQRFPAAAGCSTPLTA